MRGGAGAHRHIGISSRIHDALGEDRFAPGFAFRDHARNGAIPNDRCNEEPMQHRLDLRLLHQHVGDVFEHLAVERMARRLRLGHRRTHSLRPLLELDADAFAVDGFRMAVPGEAFDAHLRDIAAEAAVSIEEGGAGACACGRESGGKSGRSAADDQDIGFSHDVERTGRFVDLSHAGILTPRGRGRFTGRGPSP